MDDYVIMLLSGAVAFLTIFLVNYFLILKRGYKNSLKKGKKKQKGIHELVGFSYLVPKFNLDVKKMNLNYVFLLISFANAFIITTVFIIIWMIPWDIAFKMLLGFVLLFGLIYAIYELIGRHLVKKGWEK